MEREILAFWRENNVFRTSVERRPVENSYVFYDGPPFITGLPHNGTLLASIVKDVVPRFQTMRGHRVERRWGWDCHGLPAENFVEKKLNLKDKQAVLAYGLEKYIIACCDNMIQTGSLWEESIDRIGRWVEFQNAYKTMDSSYMESVWWAFKRLYDKGKIYEGEKVLMYCTRCATPVSKVEIAMDNSYKSVNDPSVFVKFKLQPPAPADFLRRIDYRNKDAKEVFLLAWTTTPWTLLANTALAVNPELNYSLVAFGEDLYVLSEELISQVFADEKDNPLNIASLKTFKGSQLVNLNYEPIFRDETVAVRQIWPADYVTAEEGSGIVHLAPAYGEEDYALAVEREIPIIRNIDENGFYQTGAWQGQNVWQVNKQIAHHLLDQGQTLKLTDYRHSYPHCHRCQTRLMYKAHPSWFLNIASQRQKMLEDNQAVNWFPEHIKNGRFKAIIETAPDWNISRDRIWATPLPVWRGHDPQTGEQKTIVVGSYQELKELSGRTLDDYHRPWVDEIEFKKDGVLYRRVDKVLDCWFESGSMPFAQHHYPFENEKILEDNFPADFIVEYVGQVRAWFYYLHVLGVALFDKPAFSNVIVTGTIWGDDGRKASKSLGNYTDPLELIEKYSADAYRLVLVASPVLNGEDFLLTNKDLADKQRKLDTLRNTLEFFLLYAAADEWQVDLQQHTRPPQEAINLFDRWILVRLSELDKALTDNLSAYNLPAAAKPLLEFIDDLSNWYVRRNRKRFWKTDNDADKQTAYHTLYFTLDHLSHLIAPICPFLAEEIYLHLRGDKQSIHLSDWPEFDFQDKELLAQMRQVRYYITSGLALRAENGIKVRQPLSRLIITETDPDILNLRPELQAIILEELNLKSLELEVAEKASIKLDSQLTPELIQEGWVRELVRHIQVLRRSAGLEVENRIRLSLDFENAELAQAFSRFEEYIKSETLARDYAAGSRVKLYEQQKSIELNGVKLIITLEKHKKA